MPRSWRSSRAADFGDIGAAVEGIAEAAGSRWCASTWATASATAMHEEPQVPNYGPAGRGLKLRGGERARHRADGERRWSRTEVLGDGWTVVTPTASGPPTFEHTIAVTEHGPEVLTLPG